jgi:hypothetical protein
MKLFGSVLVVLAVLFAQVGNVAAAPQAQDTTPITGTIVSIVTEMDAEGTTIVVVALEGGQTVRMSVETAVALGLVTLDPTTNEPVVDETKVGQTVEIDPSAVIPEEEEDFHPIAEILGDHFNVDASVVNEYHEDGFGFGVIAQAMWMSEGLNGDASAAGLILEAKRSGDYSAFTLPDGSSPTNWGQFKKALKENKNKHNLGVIVSGHADDDAEDKGNGKNKEKKEKKEKKGKP